MRLTSPEAHTLTPVLFVGHLDCTLCSQSHIKHLLHLLVADVTAVIILTAPHGGSEQVLWNEAL